MEYSRPRGCSCPRPMKGGHRPSCFLTSTPKPPRPAVSMNTETRSIGTFIESPLPSRRQQYVQTVQEYKDNDFKPLERRPKPSNGNEPLKWRPELSNSDETTQKHPLLNTRTYPTNMRPESINNVEPVKRSPEPSNSNKPLKWHPTISHSDETTKKRPMLGISTYPTKMHPESSIEPVERRPEPSNNNESLKWHPAISNSDETTKKRPMFGISTYTTKMRPESSIEPVERSPKPSNNDEPLKWHPAISNSDETTKKRPVLGISTYPTKMRPEPSIDPVERRPELSNSNERLKGRSESSNSDKRKTRRPLLSNRTYTSKTHPKTSNSNEYLKRHPLLFRSSRESLKSVNGEERKKSSRDAIGSRESEGSRGPAQECQSCLRWSACVRKQSSSDQQIASPRRKSEPERVRAAPVEHPSKECECDCHPFLPGQVSDMCTCKCDACISSGTPIHRFNEVYEEWNNDPCTSTHVQRDVHMSWDDPQRPKEEMTEKPHARFLAIPPAQLNIGSVSNNATQVPSLHNISTQTETLESVSCRKNPIWGGSRVQPVEIARLQRVRQERVLWEEPKRVQWEEPTRVQQVEVMRLQRVREERVPWEEPKRAQWVAPEDSHAAASTTCITTQHFRLVPPLTGPLFTAQKESPTKLRPVTRIYRVDLDGDDESKEDVERSPNHIKNPNEKRRSLISTSSESSVVTCHRGKVKKDLWLIFKALEGVLAIVCLALSVHVYQNLLRPVDQKSSSYQERLPYSGRLEDMDYDNSTTFAPDSTDSRDQEGLPTLMFAAFWAVCACIILILVASVAAICWGKRFCNLILIVLAILGVVAFLVFGILFVLTYKDRYPKRAVKLLMVICFILAAVFLVDLIYCICIRGKRRT